MAKALNFQTGSLPIKAWPLTVAAVILGSVAAASSAGADQAGPAAAGAAHEPLSLYPPADKLVPSPGGTTYYVDPARGGDDNAGRSAAGAWKTFARVNALRLAPGDQVVVAAGLHEITLKPSAQGTADKPVVVRFLPGVHEFGADKALRRSWYISNSCDSPAPMPVALMIENSRHLLLQGGGVKGAGKTLILMGGRMMYFVNSHAESVTYADLAFDLKRPTVSEFRVLEADGNSAVIQAAEGSTYEIDKGRFAWTGDLGSGWALTQQAVVEAGRCWRVGRRDILAGAAADDLGGGKVRLTFSGGNPGLIKGRQFHVRRIFRDRAAVFNNRGKDIVIRDCDFYAMVNMGIVSQYTENITLRRVGIAPPAGTIRTCPCWADAMQFSGCKGDVLVDSCVFSGLQDDAINVHGTYLRIVDNVGDSQLHVRFMHPQSRGFAAFAPGDVLAVVQHANMWEYPGNSRRKVTAIAPVPGDDAGRDWLLTLDGPAPRWAADDVVENITWYPNFTARNNYVTMAAVHGFIVATRGKVLVEGNTFHRCAEPGILCGGDAEEWFESGPVLDMTIRHNKFIGCGVGIAPHTSSNNPDEPVHRNIRIIGNFFDGAGISARNTGGLTITGNRFTAETLPFTQKACTDVTVKDNDLNVSN
jgi:hypothetical protein